MVYCHTYSNLPFTNRFPVVFALRATLPAVPDLLPAEPTLSEPLIVTLTYFRHEVPVLLLFYAFGIVGIDAVCAMVRRTATWADMPTLRRLLYATHQHTAAVRNRDEALSALTRCMAPQQLAQGRGRSGPGGQRTATEELLAPGKAVVYNTLWSNVTLSPARSANVLPHLPLAAQKMDYLAHLVGVLLNHLFVPAGRVSQQYDKDHMGLWQSVGDGGLVGCMWGG